MVGVVFLKLVKILNLCASPTVNRLIVIADDKQALLILCQQTEPRVLDAIGVLELVNQNMAEFSPVEIQKLLIFLE